MPFPAICSFCQRGKIQQTQQASPATGCSLVFQDNFRQPHDFGGEAEHADVAILGQVPLQPGVVPSLWTVKKVQFQLSAPAVATFSCGGTASPPAPGSQGHKTAAPFRGRPPHSLNAKRGKWEWHPYPSHPMGTPAFCPCLQRAVPDVRRAPTHAAHVLQRKPAHVWQQCPAWHGQRASWSRGHGSWHTLLCHSARIPE